MSATDNSEAGVGLDGYPLGRSGDTEPASDAATRRVWRLPLYFGFGGVVITIEPWSWRGIRRRIGHDCRN